MNVNELVTELKYQVNDSGLKRYLGMLRQGAKNARDFTAGFVDGAKQAIREQKALTAAQQQSAQASKKQKSANEDMFAKWKTGLLAVGALMGGVSLVGAADEWASIRARVGLEIDKDQVDGTLNDLYQIAQNTRQSYSDISKIYLPIARARKEIGISADEALVLTDSIAKMVALGGGSNSSTGAAITQLGQALASGELRGEELNSVMEQAPKLAKEIAESMGLTVGQLREAAKAGKLTAKEISKGLLKNVEKVNAEFAQMPKTFSGAARTVLNAIERQVDMWNRVTGAAEKFDRIMRVVADNIGHAMNIGLIAGVVLLMGKLRTIAWATALPYLKLAAVITAVYLVLEDLWGWANGKDSLVGELLGDPSEWQWLIGTVRDFFGMLKNFLGDTASTLGGFITKWGAIGLAILGVWKIISTVGPIVWGLVKGFATVMFWVIRIATALVSWPALIAAAIVAATILIYQNWDAILAYLKSGWAAFTEWLSSIVPDWVKSGASFIGSALGISSGDAAAPRASSSSVSAPTTVTNEITVNAPGSDPAAVANATGRAVQSTAESSYGRSRRGLPSVEAAS